MWDNVVTVSSLSCVVLSAYLCTWLDGPARKPVGLKIYNRWLKKRISYSSAKHWVVVHYRHRGGLCMSLDCSYTGYIHGRVAQEATAPRLLTSVAAIGHVSVSLINHLGYFLSFAVSMFIIAHWLRRIHIWLTCTQVLNRVDGMRKMIFIIQHSTQNQQSPVSVSVNGTT